MITWLIEKYKDWQFERAFQKKKKELMKLAPFIYEVRDKDDEKN